MKLDPLENEYKEASFDLPSNVKNGSFTKVVCPSCSSEVHTKDVNIQDKVAKCSSCQNIFSLQLVINSLLQPSKRSDKPFVGKQQDIDIFEYKGELNVSARDYDDNYLGVTLNLVLILGFFTVVAKNSEKIPHLFLPFLLVLIPLVLFSIYRAYQWTSNKIYIDIDDQYLTVHSPHKYLSKKKQYLVSNVKQLYTKAASGESSVCWVYMVYEGEKGEEQIKLSPKMKSRARAAYFEQEIESFMGIPDERVPDETN